MHAPAPRRITRCIPWLAAAVLAPTLSWAGPPQLTAAQRAPDLGFSVGSLRVSPSLQASPSGFWGPAATVESPDGWFASARLGQRPAEGLSGRPIYGLSDAGTLSAGYRWSASNSLSLSVTRATGLDAVGTRVQRLGLAVRYDWPTYYVRLGLDPRLDSAPRDTLRFSAGIKF